MQSYSAAKREEWQPQMAARLGEHSTLSLLAHLKFQAAKSRPDFHRLVSLGAIIGPALFTYAWFALGVLQPTVKTQYGLIGGLSGAITNPISALGVGPHAGLFNLAFVLCGLLTALGVAGFEGTALADREGTRINFPGREFPGFRLSGVKVSGLLLALSPIGLTLAGFFTLATSLVMHNVAALLVFVAPLAAFPFAAVQLRRNARGRRFGTVLLTAAPMTLILLVLFAFTFRLTLVAAGSGIAGLTERLLLAEIQAWYVAIGWFGFRASPRSEVKHEPKMRQCAQCGGNL